MGARENLQKLADRKAQEITDLERQIDMARSYLQAIQDSIKALPRETPNNSSGNEEHTGELRAGSLLARAKDAIEKNGFPMHINAILGAIGVESSKKTRVSLVGSLGGYVRKGAVFTRPAPNTFGLIGMKTPEHVSPEQALPIDFGKISKSV